MEPVTHDVIRFSVEKPSGYQFIPGQATELSVNQPGWEEEKRPFTFTSLNAWPNLEFTIKIYRDHQGVTHKLSTLLPGDGLLLREVWGAIQYRGEGVFIAGGAGVTPFIAIFRQLREEGKIGNNQLLFANKTSRDIILKEEFSRMLGDQFVNILSDTSEPGFDQGQMDSAWIRSKVPNLKRKFYICGPDPMVKAIKKALRHLGVAGEAVTVEL